MHEKTKDLNIMMKLGIVLIFFLFSILVLILGDGLIGALTKTLLVKE